MLLTPFVLQSHTILLSEHTQFWPAEYIDRSVRKKGWACDKKRLVGQKSEILELDENPGALLNTKTRSSCCFQMFHLASSQLRGLDWMIINENMRMMDSLENADNWSKENETIVFYVDMVGNDGGAWR